MIELLRAELERHQGQMAIGYTLMGSGGTEATLVGIDNMGVAIRNREGLCFYPWTAIKRIRIAASSSE